MEKIGSFLALMLLAFAGPGLVAGQSVDGDVRLIDGPMFRMGIPQMYLNGAWGYISSEGWEIFDASVFCNALGVEGQIQIQGLASQMGIYIPTGSLGHMTNVKCTGYESNLLDCEYTSVTGGAWNQEAVFMACGEPGDTPDGQQYDISLVDGEYPHEGRVEILRLGQWGTVCHKGWGDNDARVVCNELGYPGPVKALKNATFGEGVGPAYLNNVDCSGSETNVGECEHDGWGHAYCDHSKDASVVCTPNTVEVRLDGSSSNLQGSVEIRFYDDWHSICQRGWGDVDAQVLCNWMGHTGPAMAVRNYFQSSNTDFAFSNVRCEQGLPDITHCDSNWEAPQCAAGDQAGVVCSPAGGNPVSLVGGSTGLEGVVTINIAGENRKACTHRFTTEEATVVCNQLGHYAPVELLDAADFPAFPHSQYEYANFNCDGGEDSLFSCYRIHDGTACNTGIVAAIRCSDVPPM